MLLMFFSFWFELVLLIAFILLVVFCTLSGAMSLVNKFYVSVIGQHQYLKSRREIIRRRLENGDEL